MSNDKQPRVRPVRRMTIVIVVLVIVFGGIFGYDIVRTLLIAHFMKTFQAPPVTVSTVKTHSQTWQPRLMSVGTLSAINGVNISTEVSGIVMQIKFRSGQMVKKGASLVQLDDSIDVQDLKNNQAKLNLNRLMFDRKAALYKSGAVSVSDYDQALAELRQSQALVDKSLVTISQKNIQAPFAGKVGIRQVNLGQYISPGDNVVTLQSLNPLFVNFSMPEQYLPKLYLNQRISITVDAYPGKKFYGKITAINSKVSEDTRGIDVQATLPNPDNKLYPGSFAVVAVYLPQRKNVVTLPQTAVTFSLYGDTVFVVKQTGKDKKGKAILSVHQQFIKTGERVGNLVEVVDGLKPNVSVVSSGQLKLRDKMRVVINNSVKLTPLPKDQLDGS